MLKRIKRKLIGVLKLNRYVDNKEGKIIYFKISVNIIIIWRTFFNVEIYNDDNKGQEEYGQITLNKELNSYNKDKRCKTFMRVLLET